MNIRQNTLTALLVLGIGMSGCSNKDNNPISPTVDKKTDENKTERNITIVPEKNVTVDPEKNVTVDPEKNVTIDPEKNITIDPEKNVTVDPEKNVTVDPEKNVTVDPEKNVTVDPEKNVTVDPEKNVTVDPEKNVTVDPEKNVTVDPEKNVTVDPEKNRTATILGYIGSQHSNHNSTITVAQLKAITPALSNIIASNLNSYRSYIEDPRANFSTPATIAQVQIMLDKINASESVLGSIGNQHSNGSSDITVAQLQNITPALSNIDDRYLNIYQRYIASADTNISSPATVDEVQSMIDEVNDFNLPTNAILDRNFFKKTNGVFEHRFVYLAVKNNTTGRTWLNNNLGADYANVDSNAYNASQQATTSNDYLAYGSLFQWGRKADGHELFDWTGATAGTAKHGDTNVTNDNPSDSLFIKSNGNWRVNQDDTLWASESSANNVCPVGYRLPLDPNGADDGENEFAVEINTWSSKDVNGSMLSDLKMSATGLRWINGNRYYTARFGVYWGGSVDENNGRGRGLTIYPNSATPLDTTLKGAGSSVRCIKDQTPAERSVSILKVIGNDHNNNKSTVTVAQLKAIFPALENINDDYQDIYRSYIVSANNDFSSPATTAEVQSMISEVNALNLPEHAILDRSFFKNTNGAFEHRFVYLPVTNSTTGRTWLNNNLGADYANVDSSNYNASQQATAYNDYLAYGSRFQWGRKADGHELRNWTSSTSGTEKYGETSTKADEPSDPLLFININSDYDWRVNRDDTLWASESSANNVCPVGYRLPLNPNGADDSDNEFAVEVNTWSSKDVNGSMSSDLKLPLAGIRFASSGRRADIADHGLYWSGSVIPDKSTSMVRNLLIYRTKDLLLNDETYKASTISVRCIKD